MENSQTSGAPVHVVLLLDESGSMYDSMERLIQSVNKYLDTMQADKGTPVSVTTVIFGGDGSTNTRTLAVHAPVDQAPRLKYPDNFNPHGGTPLYDGIGLAIEAAELETGYNERVLVIILTDGDENASSKFTAEILKERITELLQTNTWAFVFFGEDEYSAADMAATFGLPADMVAVYNSKTFAVVKKVTARFRKAAAAGVTGKGLLESARLTQITTTGE